MKINDYQFKTFLLGQGVKVQDYLLSEPTPHNLPIHATISVNIAFAAIDGHFLLGPGFDRGRVVYTQDPSGRLIVPVVKYFHRNRARPASSNVHLGQVLDYLTDEILRRGLSLKE